MARLSSAGSRQKYSLRLDSPARRPLRARGADGRGTATAIALTASLAIVAPAGFAQTQEQEPAQAEPAQTGKAPAVTGVPPLLLQSAAEPKTKTSSSLTSPGSWHFDFGSRGECSGCTASGIQPPRNPNAPWAVRSSVTYAGAGAQVTFGVVGHRNYQLPLFMSQALGGDHDLTAPESSLTDMSRSQTRWQVSARVQKTVKRMSGGQTIGLFADVFIPINSEVAGAGAPDAPVLRSRAIRFGVVLGF